MQIPQSKFVVGIDAGSTAIKLVLYNGVNRGQWLCQAGWNPPEETRKLLAAAMRQWRIQDANIGLIYGTGYGRISLPYLNKAITEITCHARGAAFLHPGARTVIDIGGQDAKAINLDIKGSVSDFVMNDKCAAGTGRFLQVMAHALGLNLAELATQSMSLETACRINAMCTVFAETEVIGLINQGHSPAVIMAGIYQSIAKRVSVMAARINPRAPIVFSGGVAQHATMRGALEAELKSPIHVSDAAIYTGAIGAALLAWEDLTKLKH